MQTQRDHVHAYQFMVGRMTSALVLGDPAAFEPPARRAFLGLVTGVALALLATAVFGVIGLVRPGGSQAWRTPGAILLEKETGTRYVLRDGVLHPVPNQASAMLLQGNGAKVKSISRNSLAGLAHGAPIGIPGAPDPMPRPAGLLTAPPLLCLGGGAAVLVPDASAQPLPEQQYLLIRGTTDYLLWDATLYPLAGDTAPATLGLAPATAVPAADLWLDVAPKGRTIGPAPIPGRGAPGLPVGGVSYPVGQLFEQDARYWVLLGDGLASLTATEFGLLAGQADAPVPITADAVAAAPKSGDTSLTGRLPDLTPARPARLDGRSLCLRTGGSGPAVPVLADVVLPSGTPAGNRLTVDLPPSAALLAATPGGRYLVTDQGLAYPVPDDESLRALGLGATKPVAVDKSLITALPAGPSLSRAALRKDQP